MSSLRLPPDPYKILGVDKDATLPQIRLAHRRLVLQCHPDKVQDPTLKAIKVDEFQKVQEAYEILSDVSRRSEYDQTVKLHNLREELGKTSTSTPTPTPAPASTSKTYEYNVRTAEPRPTTYSSSYPKTSQKPPRESNVYSKTPPRSYEDLYEEPARPSVRRSRTTTRDSEKDERDRRRHQDEDEREKMRRKMEREAKRDHGDRKKTRDKEKRRGTEEKVRPNTYVEEESSEDEFRRKAERTARKAEDAMRAERAERAEVAARVQQEREARDREHREWEHRERERELRDRERERERERAPPALKDSPMGDKWKDHMANAARYVQASRRESDIKPEVPFAPAPPAMPAMRRAETFAAPSSAPYNIRYETVRPSAPYSEHHSDEDVPRRSSAARPSRRSVETPSKTKDTPKSSRRSTRESPYVNAASTSPPTKPTLHKHYSEPPIVGVGSSRREPSRSRTEYPREPPPPPTFTRAATFTQGMGTKEDIRDRGRGPSRIVQEPESESDSGSDSESPSPTPQYSHVRQPRREVPETTGTTKTYVINGNGRSELKGSSYRSDLHDDAYTKRNRSPSPRRTTRPPLSRSGGSAPRQVRSQSRGYHPTSAPVPEPAEPIILTPQPPKSREPSRGTSRGGYPPQYSVNYAAPITHDNIVFTTGTQYVDRRTTESAHPRDYPPYPTPRGREGIYI
ncbi:hypothetical protein SBOR_2701 [Sclerotinia borealis F-4128]|uniref:J domain-containing protein n=1 Tax=Sclerotinia borealis (strain F-4128) TaxID=1432307 RepID=W9CJG7_SCLBF|nr:hypothetical protein SBOR_2701 [Sclerotinia borealis F-4128]